MFVSASAATASAASAPADAARPMTNEEMVAHQLDLHRRIQQQMQMQMEMSQQLDQRLSLTSSIKKVEPDLGDNVFDMLDDLIMVAPDSGRASLSKSAAAAAAAASIDEDTDPTAMRDSLADIMESLDMDLDEFELGPLGDSDALGFGSVDASMLDEERDSFDDADLDLDDDLDDLTNPHVVDHGVDDDDDMDGDLELSADSPFRVSKDPNEHAVGDIGRGRLSSSDMLSSMANSVTSMSQNAVGNLCTLMWEGGLLGLRLRMSQSRLLPAVSKLTGRSSIVGIHLIDVGDLLIEIGGRSTREMEFIEAIDFLKEVPKPCKLVFRRVHSDPMTVKPIQPPVKSALALKLTQKFDELTAAEEEKAPSAPLIKLDEKYEIKWLDGPLGISLIANKDAPYPLVTRITGKNRSPQVEDVQPGHYLVQIGTYNTADGNFNTAIKYLQKVSKPVSLYFCPSNKKVSTRPDPADDEYEHLWEKKQPLAFTVRPDEKGRMVVADVGCAKSVKLKPKGPGSNATINSDDLITWINDDETKDLSFHDALLKLRTAKRPLVIRFKKAPENPVEMRAPPPVPAPPAPVHAPPPPPPTAQPVSESSPPQTAAKAPGRFNPLKKIAALGSYAKENSMNALNQRNNQDQKKPSPPDAPINKKSILPTSSAEYEPRHTTTSTSSSSHHHRDADSHHSSRAVDNDASHEPPRRPESHTSKLINLDVFSGLRKPMVSKSASDPSLHTPSSTSNVDPHHQSQPHHHAQQNGLSRQARNSGGRPHEHSANDDASHRHNPSPPVSQGADRPDEYEVTWPEGTALGLTLKVHPTTRFPMVARVTGTSNLKNIEHVTPGDVLFSANGAPIVPQPKFKHTLENLSRLPKPAVLRFRRGVPPASPSNAGSRVENGDRALPRVGSSLKDHEFELIWRENSNLGLVFSSDGDVPRVSKVDPESGGPSVTIVSVGDTLTCIGPLDIAGSSFHSSMATLRAVKRPVVLRFQRPSQAP